MKLFLAVPRQSKQTSSQTVTSPGRTREWIARLPLLNTRESLLQIQSSLYGINRSTLRISQRLKLLDTHRSPLRVARGQAESRFSRGAAPLSENDLLIAGLFRDCCVEMAFGYKTVVLEVAQTRKRSQLDEMRLSMARSLFYLEQTIFACALFRQSPPAGIWQEIHSIYYYARRLGLAEDPLKDPITKVRTSTTISLTYRRALLFGLSDPFHQSVPMMSRVQNFLRRHAVNARIRRVPRNIKQHCHFIIDPASDQPARGHQLRRKQKPPRDALLLDTVNLVRHARTVLKRLDSAEQVDIELDEELQDELGRRLLEEVVDKWGLIPTRGEERVGGDQTRIDIMIGIEAVAFCLNGEKPFTPSTVDHAVNESGPSYALQPRRSQTEILTGHVLDRGGQGLRIAAPYKDAAVGSLRVGDIIVVREKDESWTPGVIRWLRSIEDAIHFGVRKISDSMRTVAVKPVSTEREDPFKPGLAVRIERAEYAVLQLITPPGIYRHLRNLFVDNGDSLLMARASKLIENSQTMEWFECELINL